MQIYGAGKRKGIKSPALDNALRKLGQLPHELGKIGTVLTGAIRRNSGGGVLHRRSGRLADSWEWAVTAANQGWRLTIASDVRYARIHEFGGKSGAGHRTTTPARRYVSKAVEAKQAQVDRFMRDYVAGIWKA
jgi:phage gpG-like protein